MISSGDGKMARLESLKYLDGNLTVDQLQH